MSHGGLSDPADLVDPQRSVDVAETLQALAAPSRLRILGHLHLGPSSVNDLAEAAGMEPSAVSHQLKLLRLLGLVDSQREGRRVVYELHDEHVGQLLAEAMSHVEHLRLARAQGAEQLVQAT